VAYIYAEITYEFNFPVLNPSCPSKFKACTHIACKADNEIQEDVRKNLSSNPSSYMVKTGSDIN
jgi:hypothetical protein